MKSHKDNQNVRVNNSCLHQSTVQQRASKFFAAKCSSLRLSEMKLWICSPQGHVICRLFILFACGWKHFATCSLRKWLHLILENLFEICYSPSSAIHWCFIGTRNSFKTLKILKDMIGWFQLIQFLHAFIRSFSFKILNEWAEKKITAKDLLIILLFVDYLWKGQCFWSNSWVKWQAGCRRPRKRCRKTMESGPTMRLSRNSWRNIR